MVNRIALVFLTLSICLGGCMTSERVDPPDLIKSEMSRSTLPPGNMGDISEADDLPDPVGGPF
jgi:hypothetical protein